MRAEVLPMQYRHLDAAGREEPTGISPSPIRSRGQPERAKRPFYGQNSWFSVRCALRGMHGSPTKISRRTPGPSPRDWNPEPPYTVNAARNPGQESRARNLALAACHRVGHIEPCRRCGRVAEGGGLLNRYRVVKPYRGFESLRLRQR